MNTDIIEKLSKDLPSAFGRSAIDQFLPGILKSKTMANLDSAGLGPPSYRFGRKVFYEKDSFLTWLSQRVKGTGIL